ncbi:MAG: PorP/SprF family type IX secretion system membrane protein [Bacteroidales bacterium]
MKTIINKQLFVIFVIILMGCFLYSTRLKAQDAQFSQFYNSPLTLNPSLTGAFNGGIRLLANYKDQWRSVSAPYKTFAFSCDMGLGKKTQKTGFLGAGISFLSDKAGDSQLGINQVNLSLAYHVQISGYHTLSGGIMGGFAQRSINFNNLQWSSQYIDGKYDPNLPSYETGYSNNKSYSDFGAGLQWTYSKGEMYTTANNQFNMNAGIAFFHVSQPNVSFYSASKDNLPIKMAIHTNILIGFKNSKRSLIPSFEYVQQGPLKNIVAGVLLRLKLIDESKYTGFIKGAAISLGGHCRIGDAVIPQIMMEFASYAIGLSYDVNTSGLTSVTSGKGGFEISLRYLNPNPFTGKSITTKTPRFFN